MSTAQDQLHAQATTLRKKLGDAEAVVDQLRAKLAVLEAKLTGGPVPVSGLEILWQTALPTSRERSSKHLCRQEWNRLPKGERPRVDEIITALKAWNRSTEWKKDGHQFAPGLHKFIKNRMWESLPEGGVAPSRTPRTSAPVRQAAPEEVATAEDIAAIFNRLKPHFPSAPGSGL
jgi:hypothetical protein